MIFCDKNERTLFDNKIALLLPVSKKNVTIYLMITIYTTNTMADAEKYVMDVLSRVDRSNLDVMHTVIVPDRASLEAERAILRALKGSFNVQVKTFRRLAADVLPKYEYLSKQAGIMVLSGIIRDNRDKLKCYKRGIDSQGFVENIYETLSMMKYCRITPEMLARELPKSVRGKVEDIALLYRAYLDYTKDRFIDSADKLDLLCETLSQTDFSTNGYYYLYDFDNFSAQELKIIEQLMLKSRGVTIACCVGNNDGRLYLNDIYRGACNICKENDIAPNVIHGGGYAHRFAKQIGENLFRYNDASPMESDGFIEVFEGATRSDEVYSLACMISKYVRCGGRYRDVYVVASDVAKYFNAVSTVFSEFGIPYFCDRQYILADHPYARFVVDYLALCRNGGKLSGVLPFVKNYLFCGGENAEVDENVFLFENYCLKYNISYRFDRFDFGKTDEMYNGANEFRTKFNALYSTLKAPNSATVGEYVSFVRSLIEVSDLKGKNDRLAELQQRQGMDFESKVTAQAADKFENVLVQAEKVLGERLVKLNEFIRLLSTGLAAVKVSVIPVYNDCVIFANMAKARKHDVKFLALLGANQDAMPIVKHDTRLLTDRNIRDLVNSGINMEPQILTENRRERFSLFQLLLEPTDKLYISYAVSDGEDRLVASSFVRELCDLFEMDREPLRPSNEMDEDVFTEKQAKSKLVRNRRKIKDRRLVDLPSYEALCQLYGDELAAYETLKNGKEISVPRGTELYLKEASTSVSQLTDFYKCPYCFYIQYGLNVRPRTVAELQSSDLGNVLHAVLETYVRDMDTDENDEVTARKANEKFDEALNNDFYRALKNDVKMAGILSQLRQESIRMCKVVKKQFRESDFGNYATEMSFGGKSALPPVVVQFDGGQFNLVGKIDRVDTCGDRFIVIDYKSGAKAASYSEKDLYIGHKLQLPVYVRAVEDLLHLRPAGFYYFNMHDKFADLSEGERYVYNGRTLNDKDIACQIDRNLANGNSVKLGLSLKDNGEFNMQRGRTRLLNDGQFDNQVEYAFALIRRAGNLMRQGYAAVNPYEKVCDYCDYKDICDFGDVYTYKTRKVNDDVDKAAIDRTVTSERKDI